MWQDRTSTITELRITYTEGNIFDICAAVNSSSALLRSAGAIKYISLYFVKY
jgi:hypothetical protein